MLSQESYQGSTALKWQKNNYFGLIWIIFRVDRTEVGKIIHASPPGGSAEKNQWLQNKHTHELLDKEFEKIWSRKCAKKLKFMHRNYCAPLLPR